MLMLAAIVTVPATVGYPLLFVLVASWLAGANRMPWRRFLLWNALGAIVWASTVGGAAYLLGQSASGSLGAIGFVGFAIAGLVYLVRRIRERVTDEVSG